MKGFGAQGIGTFKFHALKVMLDAILAIILIHFILHNCLHDGLVVYALLEGDFEFVDICEVE